jgi:hypothetical protein
LWLLSSILQFVHNLFWLKLKWNARSKHLSFIVPPNLNNNTQIIGWWLTPNGNPVITDKNIPTTTHLPTRKSSGLLVQHGAI